MPRYCHADRLPNPRYQSCLRTTTSCNPASTLARQVPNQPRLQCVKTIYHRLERTLAGAPSTCLCHTAAGRFPCLTFRAPAQVLGFGLRDCQFASTRFLQYKSSGQASIVLKPSLGQQAVGACPWPGLLAEDRRRYWCSLAKTNSNIKVPLLSWLLQGMCVGRGLEG